MGPDDGQHGSGIDRSSKGWPWSVTDLRRRPRSAVDVYLTLDDYSVIIDSR